MSDANGLPAGEDRETYLREALSVELACSVGVPASPQPRFIVNVWVDPAVRPSLEVLARGHVLAPAHGFGFAWVFEEEDAPSAQFLLDVRRLGPVQIAFHLRFSVARMITFLEDIAQFGTLHILTSPPPVVAAQAGKRRAGRDPLFEAIEEQGGLAIVILLSAQAMRDLDAHVGRWKERYSHLLATGQGKAAAGGSAPATAGDARAHRAARL